MSENVVKRLLWVGDAACQSGFARCTHETLAVLHETFDVAVLGLNYRGDPHEYPYHIYPAMPGGDPLGFNRLDKIIALVKPDIVIIQNDPWNFPRYYQKLPTGLPVVGVVAVDGLNCNGAHLEQLDAAVFWTHFGLCEARAGGFTKPAAVIPLGVDTSFWTVGDRDDARKKIYQNDYNELRDAFVVLNLNRNQPRKRLDLTIRYFAEFVKNFDVNDAYLHLHVAPTGDPHGYDCDHLARYYGIAEKVILADLGAWNGVTDKTLRTIYHAADLQVTTTQGEGWGLPTMEGMSCGLPQIVPNWSALGEWAASASRVVPCTSTSVTHRSSVIGGVPDEEQFVLALQELYQNRRERMKLVAKGFELVTQSKYRWSAIGEQFRDVLESVLNPAGVTVG